MKSIDRLIGTVIALSFTVSYLLLLIALGPSIEFNRAEPGLSSAMHLEVACELARQSGRVNVGERLTPQDLVAMGFLNPAFARQPSEGNLIVLNRVPPNGEPYCAYLEADVCFPETKPGCQLAQLIQQTITP
jgi:hypothetical protein